jgi:DNA-binding NtrC family response regulator
LEDRSADTGLNSGKDMDLSKKLKEIKILLIDDDKWIRDSLVMYFEGEECSLSVFETAEEGLEALGRQDYQAIIADYLLPGMDGLEFFRRIRESHPASVKMLITAYGNQKVFSEAESIGVERIIEKPFTVELLKQSLSGLLQDRNQNFPSKKTQEEDGE